MRYDEAGRQALEQLQQRAARKQAEIRQLLPPGLWGPFTQEKLQSLANDHVSNLPAAEGEAFRRKAIVACAELQQLMTELSTSLDEIGEELQKVKRHGRGIAAYAQAPRGKSRWPFAL